MYYNCLQLISFLLVLPFFTGLHLPFKFVSNLFPKIEVTLRDDKHMTPMKIVYFWRPPTPPCPSTSQFFPPPRFWTSNFKLPPPPYYHHHHLLQQTMEEQLWTNEIKTKTQPTRHSQINHVLAIIWFSPKTMQWYH